MLEKLRIKITILASLIVTLYAYLHNENFLRACYAIITTIIVFYFLGGFIEIFLRNQIEKINEVKQLEENVEQLEENNEYSEYIEENHNIELDEQSNIMS